MPHIHERIDFTSEVFIVCKGKVLLRIHDKYGIYLGVGGHIELDENPIEAAIREAKEEVGLDIRIIGSAHQWPEDVHGGKELIAPMFLHQHPVNETHQHIALVYAAVSESDEVIPGEGDKSETWKWFSKDELMSPDYDIQAHIRHYANAALDLLT